MCQNTLDSTRHDSALILESPVSPLKVPELLANILGNLDRKDQVSAATVCRAWSELAIDRIWHSMKSLVPLFTLVGPLRERIDGYWEFAETIQSADWSRYAVYAPRIRHINHFELLYGKGVSNQAFQVILDHIPSSLELPRPRSIRILTMSTAPETPLEVPMISQSLRFLDVGQITLFQGQTQPDCSPYIRAIVKAAAMLPSPCLEGLSVGCYRNDAALLEAFNACLIKHSSRLSVLTATLPFDNQAWAVVFDLPNLRALDIAPLDTNVPASSEEILSKIQTLAESHPMLKILRLDLPLPSEPSLYSRLIRKLMGLQGLETLKLRVTTPLLISEAEAREMGSSWPKIRTLQLSTSGSWPKNFGQRGEPRTDLSILPSILRHIPHLTELCIPLACKRSIVIPPPEQVPVSALQVLDVENSATPEATPEAVVAYLAAVLPRGARVLYWGLDPVPAFWKKVALDLASIPDPVQPSDSKDGTTSVREDDTTNDSEDDTAP